MHRHHPITFPYSVSPVVGMKFNGAFVEAFAGFSMNGFKRAWPKTKPVHVRKPREVRENIVLEDHGDWVLVGIPTAKYPDRTTKMDKQDFLRLRYPMCFDGCGYPCFIDKNGKRILVHKWMYPDWKITDHANRDRADNRRCNLREATNSQNVANGGRRSNNTSGHTGVWWFGRKKRWVANIMIDGKQKYIGRFVAFADAVAARRKAEVEYFGEFAPCLHDTPAVLTTGIDSLPDKQLPLL